MAADPKGGKASDFLKDLLSKNKLAFAVNTKDPAYHEMVFKIADALLSSNIDINEFESAIQNPSAELIKLLNLPLDNEYATKYNGTLVNAFKIAKGRVLFDKSMTLSKSFEVTIVVPMYGEQNRIKPYNKEKNPLGQDFLLQKVKQMKWLFNNVKDSKSYKWNMILMDDGCPNNSGELANEIIKQEKLEDLVTVRYLQEMVDKTLKYDESKKDENKESDDITIKYFGDMKSTKDSRKGGAVAYGLYVAATEFKPKNEKSKHIVVATDSDLSMDLGQAGGVIYDLVSNDKMIASIGARYGTPGSFLAYPDGVVTDHTTYISPNRCRIVMRHTLRKLLLPVLSNIYDTQVGLKGFDSKSIDKIVATVKDRGSSFDMELLLAIQNHFGENKIATYPTYFVEDFESSNFTTGDNPGAYYYPQCQAIIGIYDTLVKPFDPIKENEKDRQKAFDYLSKVTGDDFEEMCKKIEKDVMPKDAFLQYNLTVDDIINATPKAK